MEGERGIPQKGREFHFLAFKHPPGNSQKEEKVRKLAIFLLIIPLWAGVDLTLSGAMFMPKASYFRDAYGTTIANFSLEGEYRIMPLVGTFLAVDYLNKSGKLTYSGEKVTLRIIPVNAGVRFHFLTFFADIGVGSWNYSEKASFATASGSLTGFFVGAGVQYSLIKFHFRLRAKYSVAKKKNDELESDLSGLQLEAGAGISF